MNNTDLIPVFRLKPNNNDSGTIKYKGCFGNDQKLADEVVEIPKEENIFYNEDFGIETLYLGKIKNYDIIANLNKCNLTGSFLLNNNELPVYYLSVNYNSTFVKGFLFEYYLVFNINEESLNQLTSPEKYNNAYLNGKYYFSFNINEEITNNYEELFTKFYKKEKNLEDNEIKHNINIIKTVLDKKYNIDISSFSKIKKHFLDFCKSFHLKDIIELLIDKRECERRKKAGIDENSHFKIPENVLDTKDLSKFEEMTLL